MAKREYTKDGLTVLWDDSLCIHCGDCQRDLPEVFNPDNRPWVNMDGAAPHRITFQVAACPSGALKIKEQTEHDGF